MVRAILERRKTMTRRIVKPQPPEHCWQALFDNNGNGNFYQNLDGGGDCDDVFPRGDNIIRCPYGTIGDRLWVRETFAPVGNPGRLGFYIRYKADEMKAIGAYGATKWKPSIFMPRSASRITLEITNVRVERLQEINQGDCFAEGIERRPNYENQSPSINAETYGKDECIKLWESINGTGSWKTNPWVWVIEFKRVK